MLFAPHSEYVGRHAMLLSPSKYHWINYSDEKFETMFAAAEAARRGTELHNFAHEAVRLGIKQRSNGTTLSRYVNDCIGFRMSCERVLFYSPNAFGSADAISFRKNLLRIFDLKTGSSPTSVHQLEVYAALFCLEYNFKPVAIDIELRIYQSNDVQEWVGDPDVVTHVMDKIVHFDKLINLRRLEEMS